MGTNLEGNRRAAISLGVWLFALCLIYFNFLPNLPIKWPRKPICKHYENFLGITGSSDGELHFAPVRLCTDKIRP